MKKTKTKRIFTSQGDILLIERCAAKHRWFAGVNGYTTDRDRVTYKDNFGGYWCKVQGEWRHCAWNDYMFHIEDRITAEDYE